MASNWWDGDKVEGSGDFWSADRVVDTTSDAVPEPRKDDSFFSLGRAKEAALGVARLVPGMEDLGRDVPKKSHSVLDTQPVSLEAADVVSVKKAVSAMAPEERVPYLRKIAQDGGLLAGAADKLVKESMAQLSERDAIHDPAARAASKLPKAIGSGASEHLALPADVGSRLEDAWRAPREMAKENLALDAAHGLNRTQVQRAGDEKRREAAQADLVQRDDLAQRRKFARENPGAAGLAVGSANVLAGTLNTPAVAADWLNKTAVNPILQLVGLPPMERVPVAPGTKYLQQAAAEYTPAIASMEPDEAWKEGKFGAWSYAQIAIQAPQLAQLIAGGSIPALRKYVLGAMGAQAAGSSYAHGDDSRIAATKGAIEIGTEMLPFKAVDKVVNAIRVMPAGARNELLRSIGQQVLKSSAVLATSVGVNAIEESAAELGGNVLDKYVAGKSVGLMDGVAKAGVIGGLTGSGFAAPGIARSIQQQASGGEAASALAAALSGGQFDSASASASVDNALRTEALASASISPMATSQAAAMGERARLEQMRAVKRQAQEAVGEVRRGAVDDIGAQDSVDGAIAAATRAVSLDSDKLLAEALLSVGIDLNELNQADAAEMAAAQAPDATGAQAGAEALAPAIAGASAPSAPIVSVPVSQSVQSGDPGAPVRTWSGRRGDGYTTPEDAERGLKERTRLQPDLDWRVEPAPDGRYRLAGYGAVQAQPTTAGPGPAERAAPLDLSVQEMEQGNSQPVLQNRDRTSAASVALMNSIAARPDYMRAGPSREMQTGSPVVVGDVPAYAVAGRSETVVDGRGDRVQAQYMVVEASSLLASNRADGTPNAGYAEGAAGTLRAVAGNGRTAGLQAAYERGTADAYRQELQADAQALGLDADAVAAMQAPVLVRVMRAEDVKRDMGDRTNIASTQDMSALEQAGNDAKRINVARLQFDEHGDPTSESVRAFIYSTPVSERGKMQNPDGSHTRQAVDRLMAATFKQAYASDDLVRLYAQATDPEARAVLSALADAAGAMAGMASAGDLDIRQAVADAAKMAVNASRQGVRLSELVQNADLDMSAEAFVVAQFLADNIRSAKRMGAGLRDWAQFAQEQARIAQENITQDGFFGDQPTVTREQLFQLIGQQDIPGAAQSARFADAAGRAERQGADSAAAAPGAADRDEIFAQDDAQGEVDGEEARPERAQDLSHLHAIEARLSNERARLAQATTKQERAQLQVWVQQAEREIENERKFLGMKEPGDTDTLSDDDLLEALELTAPTVAEVVTRQDAAAQTGKEEAARQRASDTAAQAQDERKRIAVASVAATDSFELGQDAGNAVSGRDGLMFSRAPGKAQQAQARDAEHLSAVERGDMATAQRLVNEVASEAGYVGNDYRMQHEAPSAENDGVRLDELRDNGLVPDDYWTHPEWYVSTPEEAAAHSSVVAAMRSADARKAAGKSPGSVAMAVYRAIPKAVKDGAIRNGDWVTPSLEYAKLEGESIPGGYRIISRPASAKNLYWDGNSVAEFGYDDGQSYGYKNTKNNRKLLDAVTRDDGGAVIPLSQRFNARNDDVRFSFAGEKAATADKMALSAAQARIDAGEDAEVVRRDTGWHEAADGKWRFEISDEEASLKDESSNADVYADVWHEASQRERGVPLGMVLNHPSLFAAYPALQAVRVKVDGGIKSNGALDAENNTIVVKDPYDYRAGHKELLSVLLHEIQHGIQNIEGFATGGAPSQFADPAADRSALSDGAILSRLTASQGSLEKAKTEFAKRFKREPAFGAEAAALSGENPDSMQKRAAQMLEPHERYRRLAGETEARNTQARQKMTDAQRRAAPPRQTADVADADVIVVFNGKEMRSAPVPVNAGGDAMSPELARAILGLRPAPATKDSVRAAVRELVDGLGLLPNSLGRIVVATSAEIKQEWEPLIGPAGMEASGDAGRAQGFYDPKSKTVFLIADSIKAGDELGVVAHELMHKHGPAVLGKEGWNQLHGAIGGWAKAKAGSMERIVYDEAARRVNASGPELSNQELFPYAVQVALEMGVRPDALAPQGTVARWLGQVRSALRQVWSKIAGGKGFNSLDLVNLAFGIAQRENPAHAGELDNAIKEGRDEGAAKDQTQTEAFKRWFGDSAVVDAAGQPLQVFHGTGGDFSVFTRERAGSTSRAANAGMGFFFTDRPEVAGRYAQIAGGDQNVMPVYLLLQNPLRLSAKNMMEADKLLRAELQPEHDGAIVAVAMQGGGTQTVYMARESGQVKSSSGNNGAFDRANPDIRYSRSTAQGEATSFSRESPAASVRADDESIVADINRAIARSGAQVAAVATFDELPQHVKDVAAANGVKPAEMRGITLGGGRVYIVQGNHSSATEVEATIVHEVYGHVGIRALFGADIYRRLNKLYLSLGESRVRALAEKYGVDASYFEMARSLAASQVATRRAGGATELRNGWLTEELLAHIAESETGTLRQRAREVAGAVRAWLRDHGFMRLADLGMTDIAHILKRGRIALQTQTDFSGAEDVPAFSRANGGFDLPEESRTQSARRKAQDFFLRAQVVQEAIAAQGGKVDEQSDFYRAEELSHGRMGSLLKDFATDQVQPMMEKLVEMGIDLDELSLYAYAKHAPERNREISKINKALPDGGSGMSNAEAAGIIQMVDLSGERAKLDALHADLMAITSTNRLAMLTDGLITQDEFNALGKYENYVPLRGFEVMDEGDKPTGRPAGRGFNIRGNETMRALGRRSRAGQLIENVIGDYQRTVVRGERNHVAKVFLNFVLRNPDPDLWEIDAQRTKLALDRQSGRVIRNTLIDKGEDTISVKVAGQEIYIKINDPLLLRAMRKQHADDMGEQHRVLVKALGLYTTLLRNTLTRYNPEFALVNAARDFGFGALAAFDEMGAGGMARFMGNYAGATAASFRSERNKTDPQGNRWDRTLMEYKAAGGATSGFYAKDLEGISSDIRGMMIKAGAETKDWTEAARHNVVTRQVERFGRVLEFAGSVSENAARVAAYQTARDMGQSPSKAASIAKNLTTNFDRKGEWGSTLNAAYVFFNAAVQGSHRTLKMFANPKVAGVLMGSAAGAVGLAMFAASAGGDDPDDGIAYWDKIPAHVKERNLIIMLPPGAVMNGAEQVGTNGRYITIPVQYGLNVFPVIGYQIADVIRNQQDKTRGVTVHKAAITIASAIAGSFNPLGGAVDLESGSSVGQALAPSVFDPVIQGTTGTNGFGREVAPFKSPFDTKPDSQNANVRQAGGPAEAVARWINRVTGGSEYESGAIDVSPGTVENTVRNLTGGMGVFLYDLVALAGKQIDEFNGEAPDRFTKDIPVWRRVRGDIDGDVDQGRFYESRRRIQEARGIQKRMEDSDEDVELVGEKEALAGMDKGANRTTRALSKIRKQMAEIQRDENISNVERKVRIHELRAERDALVNEFNRDFMDTMREYFEAPSDAGQ